MAVNRCFLFILLSDMLIFVAKIRIKIETDSQNADNLSIYDIICCRYLYQAVNMMRYMVCLPLLRGRVWRQAFRVMLSLSRDPGSRGQLCIS